MVGNQKNPIALLDRTSSGEVWALACAENEQEQLHGGNRASRCKDIYCLSLFVAMHITKYLTLTMKVKVMECTNGNDSIRWKISKSIKVMPEHFLLALTVFEIFPFQNSSPWKCRSRSWSRTFVVAPFDDKCLTSYLIAIVMFAFSQRLPVAIGTWKGWPWKFRSRSWSTTFAMVPSDDESNLNQSHTWAYPKLVRFQDIHISKFVTSKM